MNTAIMQPYFLPYIGYWQLIKSSDNFVIFDDVNFKKKGFINRNSFLVGEGLHQFVLETNGASQNKFINEIKVGNNSLKLLKTIHLNYKKAPYHKNVMPILEDIFYQTEKNLAKFITYSLKKICFYLEIETNFKYSSEIKKNNDLKSQDKILDICEKLNTTNYINPINGQNLYSKEKFLQRNIRLFFLETKLVEYKQFQNNFISNLSIIDIMMFNTRSAISNMIKNYKLI